MNPNDPQQLAEARRLSGFKGSTPPVMEQRGGPMTADHVLGGMKADHVNVTVTLADPKLTGSAELTEAVRVNGFEVGDNVALDSLRTMVARNDHTGALLKLVGYANDQRLMKVAEALKTVADWHGDLPAGMDRVRYKLKVQALKKIERVNKDFAAQAAQIV